MERMHPFWHEEQQKAYVEAALVVLAKGPEEVLTPRRLVSSLGKEAVTYVQRLPCGFDERPAGTFMDDLTRHSIVSYDHENRQYTLGEMGHALVTQFFEEWAGQP